MKNQTLKYDIPFVAQEIGLQKMKDIAISQSSDAVRIGLTNHPHLVEGVICAICVEGNAKLKINFQLNELKPQTLMFVLPNSMMEPVEVSEDLRIDTIYFSFDYIAQLPIIKQFDLLEDIRTNPCTLLDKDYYQIFQSHHANLVKQYYRSVERGKENVLNYLLCALVSDVHGLYDESKLTKKKLTRKEQLTNQFFRVLLNYYKMERSITFYADKMNLTPKYLTTSIRKQTNKSISDWIVEAVISHAKSELKSTDKTIQEITDELNFTEISLFSRYFKRYTSMTPTEYRKLH